MGAAAPGVAVADASPRSKARVAGAFYLLNIVTGAAAAMLAGRGQTAYGYALNIAATVSYLVVTALFYELFKPVDRSVSVLAALFSIVGCALGALATFHLKLVPISNLVFFGCYCLLIGYLICTSALLPRVLGAVMIFAGLGWLTFLSPSLADRLAPYNFAPGILGETLLTAWLLVRGVDVGRWNELASGGAGIGAQQARR